ncbi:MAG: putative nucleotidyltransferase component of viral defense system [Natrialbaceae archaeon]|jgi:predicted nucleotidyltransferase component of viral defense system
MKRDTLRPSTRNLSTDILLRLKTQESRSEGNRRFLSLGTRGVPQRWVFQVCNHAILARLCYEGPLFDGTDRSRGSIEVDVSPRSDVVRDPEWRRLFVPYPETRTVTVRCLAVEEALAEKPRALSTRSRGRDLYDCWFLLRQEVAIDPELFERKMDVLGEPTHVTVSITEREWNRDLSILLERPPAYDVVYETVMDAIHAAGLPVDSERS